MWCSLSLRTQTASSVEKILFRFVCTRVLRTRHRGRARRRRGPADAVYFVCVLPLLLAENIFYHSNAFHHPSTERTKLTTITISHQRELLRSYILYRATLSCALVLCFAASPGRIHTHIQYIPVYIYIFRYIYIYSDAFHPGLSPAWGPILPRAIDIHPISRTRIVYFLCVLPLPHARRWCRIGARTTLRTPCGRLSPRLWGAGASAFSSRFTPPLTARPAHPTPGNAENGHRWA